MNHRNSGSRDRSQETVVIVSVRRISQSQPTAWEGLTDTGNAVHISYLYGVLRVEMAQCSPGKPGWIAWRTILHVKPALMMMDIDSRNGAEAIAKRSGRPLEVVKREMRAEVEAQILREIKSANWGGSGKKPRVVTLWELSNWLDLRNDHLPMLRAVGLDGGLAKVELRTIFESASR